MDLQKPKGTIDIYGKYAQNYQYLIKVFTSLCNNYNYNYIETPIFENSNLFKRSIGDTSDIVNKETYDFKDKGDREMTLRPEGTAGVVRAFSENKMYAKEINKLYYHGPFFRYERPQAYRYRQFYQLGVEVYGSDKAIIDADVIYLGYVFYKMIGFDNVSVKINTLGTTTDRINYINALKEYFNNHTNVLCSDCKSRLSKNALRILDCKVDSHLDIMKTAPQIEDFLSDDAKDNFSNIKNLLEEVGVSYEVDNNLVRGLDYYTGIVFEYILNINDKEITVGGGGRYDMLCEQIGAPKTPGVGFGLGLTRILDAICDLDINLPVDMPLDAYIINVSENEEDIAFKLCNLLRINGFRCDMDYLGKAFKNKLKVAFKNDSKFVITIGDDEVKNNTVQIKNSETKEVKTISIEDVVEFLDESCEIYD